MSRFVLRSAGLPIEKLSKVDFTGVDFNDRAGVDDAIESARRALWSCLDDADFLHALATINPSLFQMLLRKRHEMETSRRTSYVRRLERSLFNMLVRFCTRNDTTGSAGLTSTGNFDEALSSSFVAKFGSTRTGKHITFTDPEFVAGFGRWLDRRFITQLRRRKSEISDRSLQLPARYRWRGHDVVDTSTGMSVEFDDDLTREILTKCATGCSTRELIDASPTQTWDRLEHLVGRGHVVPRALIPEDRANPLAELAASLRRIAWRDSDLQEVAARLEAAETLRLRAERAAPADRTPLLLEAGELLKGLSSKASEDSRALARHVRLVVSSSTFWEFLVLRRSDFYVWQGVDLVGIHTGITFEIGDEGRAVIDACDGVRNLATVRSSLDLQVGDLAALIDNLFEHGVLRLQGDDSCVPAADWQDDLTFVSACAELLVNALSRAPSAPELEALRGAIAGSVLESSSVHDADEPPAFLEEFAHDIADLAIGGPLLAKLRKSTVELLTLLAYAHYVTRLVIEPPLKEGFSLPLLEFQRRWEAKARDHGHVVALSRLFGAQHAHDAAAKVSWLDGLKINWELSSDGVLTIHSIVYPPPFVEWLRTRVILSNPDMMVLGDPRGSAGSFNLLLNETHSASRGLTPLTTRFGYLHGEEFAKGDAVAKLMGEIGMLIWPDPAHDKVSFGARIGMPDVFFLAMGGELPTSDGARMVPASSVNVMRRAGRLVFRDSQREFVPFELQSLVGDVIAVGDTGQLAKEFCASLIPDRSSSGAQPEVRLGDLVIGRRQTVLSAEEVFSADDTPVELMRRARELRARATLPRYWFLRVLPHKPFMVDTENVFSLENARDFLRKSGAETVQITAMAPAPDELWFEHNNGHFTSEIRYAAALVGSEFGGGHD